MATLTVRQLIDELKLFPDNASVILMPEDGDAFEIERIIHYPNEAGYPEAWIVFSDFYDDSDIEEGTEKVDEVRLGDMYQLQDEEEASPKDVIKIRGKLRQA